jgi:hypothetical protein
MTICFPPPCLQTLFQWIDIRAASAKCVCSICSQSTSLTELYLNKNEIGAAGAASIGDALSYVNLFRWYRLDESLLV